MQSERNLKGNRIYRVNQFGELGGVSRIPRRVEECSKHLSIFQKYRAFFVFGHVGKKPRSIKIGLPWPLVAKVEDTAP